MNLSSFQAAHSTNQLILVLFAAVRSQTQSPFFIVQQDGVIRSRKVMVDIWVPKGLRTGCKILVELQKINSQYPLINIGLYGCSNAHINTKIRQIHACPRKIT